jgi:hypothetical protein
MLLKALAIALILAAVLPRPALSLFGYHSWRKTQTFAAYTCFQKAGGPREFALCAVAATPGFTEAHYVGREIQLFPLADYAVNRHQRARQVTSWLPFATFCWLTGLLVAAMSEIRPRSVGLLWAAGAFVACRASPILAFFAASYQPDLFAVALLATGVVVARSRRPLPGALLVAMSALTRPMLLLIGLAALSIPHGVRVPRAWRIYATQAAIVVLPFGLFLLAQAMLERAGMPRYPLYELQSWPPLATPTEWIYETGNLLVELGDVTVAFFVVSIAALAWPAVRRGEPEALIGPALVAGAFGATFWVLFPGFQANSYYGIIALAALVVVLLQLVPAPDRPGVNVGGWRVFAMVAIVSALSVPALRWAGHASGADTSRENALAHGVETHCTEIGDVLGALVGQRKIYLDCIQLDPTCRAALEYHGTSLFHANLARDRRWVTKLREENAIYASCAPYSFELTSDPRLQAVLNAEAHPIYRHEDVAIYSFGAP